ncbi:MAG: family 20 glycosylhydrolase [Verrucomicrobiota bacterium]
MHHGVYCAGREQSFQFLEDVLREVIPLFPAKYLHIGGDEVQKQTWRKCSQCQARIKTQGLKSEEELQSWFIRRMERFIAAQGKTLIGWSEILQGGLPPNAVLMDWLGGGLEAARAGHDVVMTPGSYCYFDHYQTRDIAVEPRAIGGFTSLEKVYAFDPLPLELEAQFAPHILGAQANLWTEYIGSLQHLEYMLFPRLCALAEVTWSPKSSRSWSDFTRRLASQEQRLDELGVRYHNSRGVKVAEWQPQQIQTRVAEVFWDVTTALAVAGQYRVTFEYGFGNHGIVIDSVVLLADGQPVARDGHDGFAGVEPRNATYVLDVPNFKPGAKYTLQAALRGDGGTDSRGVISWTVSIPDSL